MYAQNFYPYIIILSIYYVLPEYPIRIGILGTVIPLLEKNTEFRKSGDTPFGQENEDRLYEIPVKMLNDFNQQVM